MSDPDTTHLVSKPAILKPRYTHEAMIDLIIAQPSISQNALAAHFGYTPGWVSRIITSDAFQAQLAKRRGELIDPAIREGLAGGFKSIVARSLEILEEKLNAPSDKISNDLVLRAFDIASKAAGYGARDAAPVQVNVPVDVNIHLDKLKANLTKMLRAETVEGEVIDPDE